MELDYLVEEALQDSQSSDDGSVYREHDVIQSDWIETAWKPLEVFVLDVRDPIERRVEHRIQSMAEQIECQEIEVQSNHWLSFEVVPDLRVERNRPGGKVNPSNDERDENEWRRMGNDDPYKKVGVVNNTGRRCVAEDFNMTWVLSEEADDLWPATIWIRRDGKLIWGDSDEFVVIFVKVDSQWNGYWSTGICQDLVTSSVL